MRGTKEHIFLGQLLAIVSGLKKNYSLGRVHERNCKAFVKIFGHRKIPVCSNKDKRMDTTASVLPQSSRLYWFAQKSGIRSVQNILGNQFKTVDNAHAASASSF